MQQLTVTHDVKFFPFPFQDSKNLLPAIPAPTSYARGTHIPSTKLPQALSVVLREDLYGAIAHGFLHLNKLINKLLLEVREPLLGLTGRWLDRQATERVLQFPEGMH